MIIPIVLSGGSGTRLWPLSRKLYPKQFLKLIDKTHTVFQNTFIRLPINLSNPIVVCNEEHRFLAAEQLREIGIVPKNIILEPFAKNTAPAIALAAFQLIANDEDPILLVLPADHIIDDVEKFHDSIKIAQNLAKKNKLVTFGIEPNKPETGYGYIEVDFKKKSKYYNIKSFVEKPGIEDAHSLFKSGNYLWNSGMFMFKASIFLSELKRFEPEIYISCKKSIKKSIPDLHFIRIDNKSFFNCPEKSIDYAVMEQTTNAMTIPLKINWADIGSWKSLIEHKTKDSYGNVFDGDIVEDNVINTYAYSSERLITLSGVSDLIVIDTKDALLVIDKNNIDEIKNLVQKLKIQNRQELDEHKKIYRPWGNYNVIDKGEGFQSKRIMVNPGSKISLQKHRFRAEHWIIVSGIATITCGNKTFQLKENESTFIPKGETHRLENKEVAPLEIIEVQTGEYLNEDDIIRIEDDYNRV